MSDLPSVVVLGVSAGLQAALLAIGLVLVYRASRFINGKAGDEGIESESLRWTEVIAAISGPHRARG